MLHTTFSSPEAAAAAGFPDDHCRVLASSTNGDEAYVLMDAGSGGHRYLYGSTVIREAGGWTERTSGNGPGWTRTHPELDLGALTAWGDAPAGADRVRVTFRGAVREEPVVDGAYLVVWWNVPCPPAGGPEVTAFRRHGRWG